MKDIVFKICYRYCFKCACQSMIFATFTTSVYLPIDAFANNKLCITP